MVVGADNKVEARQVTTSQAIGDKWLVTDGVKAGERVISTGLQRAKPGAQVTPQEVSDDAKAAPDSKPQSDKSSS
jgi:membrane fusion protein (multidrug efflux system)